LVELFTVNESRSATIDHNPAPQFVKMMPFMPSWTAQKTGDSMHDLCDVQRFAAFVYGCGDCRTYSPHRTFAVRELQMNSAAQLLLWLTLNGLTPDNCCFSIPCK
jgi:hypothetical protein